MCIPIYMQHMQIPKSTNFTKFEVVTVLTDSDEEIFSLAESIKSTPIPGTAKLSNPQSGSYQEFCNRYLDREGLLKKSAVMKMISGMEHVLSRATPESFCETLLSLDRQAWAETFLGFDCYDRGILKQYWNSVLVNRFMLDSADMLSSLFGECSTETLTKFRLAAFIYSDNISSPPAKRHPSFNNDIKESPGPKYFTPFKSSSPAHVSTHLFSSGNEPSPAYDESSSSRLASREDTGSGKKNYTPRVYHHAGNTKHYYMGQRHFAIQEDLHIAKAVLELSAELLADGWSNQAILNFIRSDSWDYCSDKHRSLQDRVNQLNTSSGLAKRSGMSLKGRWKVIVSCVIDGTSLPFLLDASVDAERFKGVVNDYYRVAINSRRSRSSSGGSQSQRKSKHIKL